MFASSFLPCNLPNYWDIVATFANIQAGNTVAQPAVSPAVAKMTIENMQVMHPEAFLCDKELTVELVNMEYGNGKEKPNPLGIPLIPNNSRCVTCGGKLLLRKDRPSRITLYTDSLGTVPATHFHRYCQNSRKGCKTIQFYGYYSIENGNIVYNDDWMVLPYFLASQETGFEISMLRQFDAELLIGQISYKQKADIYNVSKRYDTVKKECSTIEKVIDDRQVPVHGYVHNSNKCKQFNI